MSEISSGLVAVAWQVRNGWSSCDLYRTLKSATEDRDMLQKRADFAGNLMAYRVEPLVRLSDAEAIIAQKDAEILEQCRINGIGAEREASLLGQIERQSAALKLAKDALESCDVGNCSIDPMVMPSFDAVAVDEALAAIDALKGE